MKNKKINQIEWKQLNPQELVEGIEIALENYSKRQRRMFEVWRYGIERVLEESMFKDWESFHDFLDFGDYNARKNPPSPVHYWIPHHSFAREARWILVGGPEEEKKYKTELIEPAVSSDGKLVRTLGRVLRTIEDIGYVSLNFPKIRLRGRKTKLSLSIGYWLCEDGDIDQYYIDCSRRLEKWKRH